MNGFSIEAAKVAIFILGAWSAYLAFRVWWLKDRIARQDSLQSSAEQAIRDLRKDAQVARRQGYRDGEESMRSQIRGHVLNAQRRNTNTASELALAVEALNRPTEQHP